VPPIKALLLLVFFFAPARADEPLTIAVSSNFRHTAENIAATFAADSGIRVRLSSGSTGKLYAQIVNGAPFDIFLAADVERPKLLEQSGLAAEGTLFPYAIGKLVLISADPALRDQNCLDALEKGFYKHLAIANPDIAPYGAAAKAYLQAEGLWGQARSRVVVGENIAQAFLFVATGNAALGIVSVSQIKNAVAPIGISCKSAIQTADENSLVQSGIVLRRSTNQKSARAFMMFLRSTRAREIIVAHGYEVPSS
jgi:molybdate transport system substrate-binding protein